MFLPVAGPFDNGPSFTRPEFPTGVDSDLASCPHPSGTQGVPLKLALDLLQFALSLHFLPDRVARSHFFAAVALNEKPHRWSVDHCKPLRWR